MKKDYKYRVGQKIIYKIGNCKKRKGIIKKLRITNTGKKSYKINIFYYNYPVYILESEIIKLCENKIKKI